MMIEEYRARSLELCMTYDADVVFGKEPHMTNIKATFLRGMSLATARDTLFSTQKNLIKVCFDDILNGTRVLY